MKLDAFEAEKKKLSDLNLMVCDGTEDMRQAQVPQSFAEGDIIESINLVMAKRLITVNGTEQYMKGVLCKVTNKVGVSRDQLISYNTLTGSLVTEKNCPTTVDRTPRFLALYGAQFEEIKEARKDEATGEEKMVTVGYAFPFHFKVKIDKVIDAYNTEFGNPVFEDENGVRRYNTPGEAVKKGISTGANLIK